jgi:DNA-binding transcriptional ArsR family regulator
MGLTKTSLFTDYQNDMANIFKAIGHPARIAILDYLLKIEGCICNDIVNELGLAQATVSQHLKELKNAGIIKGTIEGKGICYCIDPQIIQKINEYFIRIYENDKIKNCC